MFPVRREKDLGQFDSWREVSVDGLEEMMRTFLLIAACIVGLAAGLYWCFDPNAFSWLKNKYFVR